MSHDTAQMNETFTQLHIDIGTSSEQDVSHYRPKLPNSVLDSAVLHM